MKRAHVLGGAFALTLVVVIGREVLRDAAPPPLPQGAHYEHAARTVDDWLREGYVEMVSSIRPPTSEDGSIRIVVYVKWPDGALVRVTPNGDDYTLEMPVGTRADRVELQGSGDVDAEPSRAWHVLDVRGTTFEPTEQRFHVLRPVSNGSENLLGIDWSRNAAIDEDMARALGELLVNGQIAGPSGASERVTAADHLRKISACASCHVPNAPARRKRTDRGLVNRGTDASGLYQIASVLRDRLPFETYRPRDANRGDPFIRRTCGAEEMTSAACADGSIPMGELDVRKGLAARDRHVLRVCASRLALGSRLSGTSPQIAASIDECRSVTNGDAAAAAPPASP